MSGSFALYLVSIVLLALAISVYFRQRRKARLAAHGAPAADKEIEAVIRDAQTRLEQSSFAQSAGRDANLIGLPVFFLAGEAGSAKTSTVLHSGTAPDLLAGTRVANIWIARKTLFVEAGGAWLSDPDRWAALVKQFSPAQRWWRIFSRRPAARAVIACVNSEAFVKPNPEEALAAVAHNLRTRLGEISKSLGVPVPVYVLFTKLDRIPFFLDFVRNMSDEEAAQVLGATLPVRADGPAESRLLAAAFDDLFDSLCTKRRRLLARESDPAKRSAINEFPDEFRKLQDAAVRFLVDLGRPSQPRANPFLCGFYFSGVRPVVLEESAPPARSADPATSGSTRRVPQWLFLDGLFRDVLLSDGRKRMRVDASR